MAQAPLQKQQLGWSSLLVLQVTCVPVKVVGQKVAIQTLIGLLDIGDQVIIIWGPYRDKLMSLQGEGGVGWMFRTNVITHVRQVCMCLWVGPFRSFLVLVMVVLTAEYIIGIDIFGCLQNKTSTQPQGLCPFTMKNWSHYSGANLLLPII